MPRRKTLKQVKEIFKAEGCILLSETYVGARSSLEYECPNGHKSRTNLFYFTQGYGRCPCLSKRKAWKEYNLVIEYPEVLDDWDYKLNRSSKPEDFTPGSNKKVWWYCFKCSIKHSYKQSISKHTHDKRRCPYFVGRKAGYGNDLYTNYKEMCDKEWDWNLNEKHPSQHTTKTSISVWWCCGKCQVSHSYQMRISDKTSSRACPYVAGKKVGYGNSVLARYPKIVENWDYSLNKKGPDKYSFGSNKKVWFKHQTEDGDMHKWKSSIKNRTLNKTGCPKCNNGGVSKISQTWLDSFDITSLIKEHLIKIGSQKFKVDGFDPKTNTVYEFLGDFWHGNPGLYKKGKIHPIIGLSFGELYENSLKKLEFFKKAGYNVIYIWESDYSKNKESMDE